MNAFASESESSIYVSNEILVQASVISNVIMTDMNQQELIDSNNEHESATESIEDCTDI